MRTELALQAGPKYYVSVYVLMKDFRIKVEDLSLIQARSHGTFSAGVKNYFTGSLKLFIYVKGL